VIIYFYVDRKGDDENLKCPMCKSALDSSIVVQWLSISLRMNLQGDFISVLSMKMGGRKLQMLL
jgi:hypothetical protein